jgi:radical SAM protein with 4Fe4S-binding SPASM domain
MTAMLDIQPTVNKGNMGGKGQTVAYAPAFDHLVYVRIFEGCNLHCKHCFIPANPKKMTDQDIQSLGDKVRKFAAPGQTILLQWHGGEPTLFGAAWMRDAIRTVENAAPEFQWRHGIQTNLMTYSQEWADVYHEYFGGHIGISWDPKIRLLHKKSIESNKQYENTFWKNVQLAQQDGLALYMVTTFTKTFVETYQAPIDFFNFIAAKGIKRIHLERITPTGVARDNWHELGLNNAEYVKYMRRFAKAYAMWQSQNMENDVQMFASPFDGLLSAVRSLDHGQNAAGYGCWSGVCDTRFHTIDANGYKAGCTALTSEVDNVRATTDLAAAFSDPAAERHMRQGGCKSCKYHPICSTGCLTLTVHDGSGECSGGYGLFQEMERIQGMFIK